MRDFFPAAFFAGAGEAFFLVCWGGTLELSLFTVITFAAVSLTTADFFTAKDLGGFLVVPFLIEAEAVFPAAFAASLWAGEALLFLATALPFCLAHRARCAAAIRSFPAGLKIRRFAADSSGFKPIVLFLEPLGRPRRFGSADFPEVEAF